VSRNNSLNILHDVKAIAAIGVKEIKIGPIYGRGKWSPQDSFMFAENMKLICDFSRNNFKKKDQIIFTPINKHTPHIDNKFEGVWGCSAGLSNLAFTPDGNIIGCSSMAPLLDRFPFFQIGTIEKLFKDDALKCFSEYRNNLYDKRIKCKICNFKDNCSGGCLAINASSTGNPLIPPNNYCEAIKIIPEAWKLQWGVLNTMIIKINFLTNAKSDIQIRKNAFKQQELINSINHNNVIKNSSGIEIKNFFTEKSRVQDSWRYDLKKDVNGNFILIPHTNKTCFYPESNFNERSTTKLGKKPIVLILIESPHKEEFSTDGSFIPKGPAQGKTGANIKNYLSKLVNKYICKDILTENNRGYHVVISNPIQFQTSLFELHGTPLSRSGCSALRNKIWLSLMEFEKQNFIKRLNQYEPSIIINACTSKLKKHVYEILSNCFVQENALIYEAEKHPCVWNKKTTLQKKG
jgi:radical SAM protein with 4Fe4S-binding SPASM domain